MCKLSFHLKAPLALAQRRVSHFPQCVFTERTIRRWGTEIRTSLRVRNPYGFKTWTRFKRFLIRTVWNQKTHRRYESTRDSFSSCERPAVKRWRRKALTGLAKQDVFLLQQIVLQKMISVHKNIITLFPEYYRKNEYIKQKCKIVLHYKINLNHHKRTKYCQCHNDTDVRRTNALLWCFLFNLALNVFNFNFVHNRYLFKVFNKII